MWCGLEGMSAGEWRVGWSGGANEGACAGNLCMLEGGCIREDACRRTLWCGLRHTARQESCVVDLAEDAPREEVGSHPLSVAS